MHQGYWLYTVYHCAIPITYIVPAAHDPFGNLLARAKGSILINNPKIAKAAKILPPKDH
jgi:hypothetical protein